ncbi:MULTISPECIES: hypothetical protein [Nocardioides]|uniref:Uncharacterized protein n=1 Tax=Nocardioides vastitatis TaxID=2568655 RepID=A0ABW0ZFK6_9ACTN|nr:hypothetical protein [Nocardioides sp.]THI99695.1 hypothetical protein E7Z54_12390 [Nocardioides sp.]
MKHIRRATAATAAAAALVLAPVSLDAADAAPTTAKSRVVKTQVKQLVRDIALKDRLLARVDASKTVTRLADENEGVLRESIASDRTELRELRAEAGAADSTRDTRSLRREVRSYRVEIYTQAAGIVRAAEELSVRAAEDEEALALIDIAIDAALALHAQSPKSDIAVARGHLADAETELEDSDDPVDPETPVEPVA